MTTLLRSLAAIFALILAIATPASAAAQTRPEWDGVERCWYAAMLAWLVATAAGLLVG